MNNFDICAQELHFKKWVNKQFWTFFIINKFLDPIRISTNSATIKSCIILTIRSLKIWDLGFRSGGMDGTL